MQYPELPPEAVMDLLESFKAEIDRWEVTAVIDSHDQRKPVYITQGPPTSRTTPGVLAIDQKYHQYTVASADAPRIISALSMQAALEKHGVRL